MPIDNKYALYEYTQYYVDYYNLKYCSVDLITTNLFCNYQINEALLRL